MRRNIEWRARDRSWALFTRSQDMALHVYSSFLLIFIWMEAYPCPGVGTSSFLAASNLVRGRALCSTPRAPAVHPSPSYIYLFITFSSRLLSPLYSRKISGALWRYQSIFLLGGPLSSVPWDSRPWEQGTGWSFAASVPWGVSSCKYYTGWREPRPGLAVRAYAILPVVYCYVPVFAR
jgi:hypothetical protein